MSEPDYFQVKDMLYEVEPQPEEEYYDADEEESMMAQVETHEIGLRDAMD
jgi:hypothetical protein